jgi:hypothetical protein
MNCCNLSRNEAIEFEFILRPDINAWISINEPGFPHTESKVFDRLNNVLKICFWDVVSPVPIIGTNEVAMPPTDEDAKLIVDFILDSKGKNMYVNCKAGKSRSAAVCQFLQDMLGYNWNEYYKKRAEPNPVLYKKMVDYWLTFNTKPTKIVDKRRRDYLNEKVL